MIILCLGHNRTSGDIRYGEPDTVYLVRLNSKWNRFLEKLADQKMRMHWQKQMQKLLNMPFELISIDRKKMKNI